MTNSTNTDSGAILARTSDDLAYADATDVVAKDFIALKRRGFAAKAAAIATGAFHGGQ